MPHFPSRAQPDAASIASHALCALRRAGASDRDEALAKAERQAYELAVLDAGDAERIEVLHGALQALAGPRQDQVQAGIYLLEHLASCPQTV